MKKIIHKKEGKNYSAFFLFGKEIIKRNRLNLSIRGGVRILYEYKILNIFKITTYVDTGKPFKILKDSIKIARFLRHKIKNNSVLIIESVNFHGETIPGFIQYFLDLNYNVDTIINSGLARDKALNEIQFSKKINIFDMSFDGINFILKKQHIKKYKLLFFNSLFIYNNKMVSIFGINKNIAKPSNGIIAVDHASIINLERYFDKNHTISLMQNKTYKHYVNPHYFGKTYKQNKNDITRFMLAGRLIIKENKNINILFNAIDTLLNENIRNFIVIIIGSIPDENHIFSDNIKFMGYLNYKAMYEEIRKSDFILPMLDPQNPLHDRYLEDVSGSFQLIYGFNKIPIIHNKFAKRCKIDNKNGIVYQKSLSHSMKKAIKMKNEEYQIKKLHLKITSNEIYTESLENLRNIIKEI